MFVIVNIHICNVHVRGNYRLNQSYFPFEILADWLSAVRAFWKETKRHAYYYTGGLWNCQTGVWDVIGKKEFRVTTCVLIQHFIRDIFLTPNIYPKECSLRLNRIFMPGQKIMPRQKSLLVVCDKRNLHLIFVSDLFTHKTLTHAIRRL